MNKKTIIIIFCLLLLYSLWQRAFAQTLDAYIQKGLDSNLAIKQKSFDLKKARLDLDRAKALFYPQASFNSQYTLANGGRTIEVPIGDLLNNVYSSLNQLTSSAKFPQVKNQSIQFLPNDYHDTRVEVNVPLYDPQLWYNKMIKQEMITNQEEQVNLYKRELVNNIKQAYFQYLQSVKALTIFENALATDRENLRFAEKLVKNNAATKEVVLKAKAEVSQVQTSLANAEQNHQNAAAYFNFLLNQPLETSIGFDSAILHTLENELQLTMEVPEKREELMQLKSSQRALEMNLKLNQSYKLPVISGFYNIGFQGYGFKFDDRQLYQLGGLQLQWNIFKGNDNRLKVRQSEIDIDAIKNQYEYAVNQIQLQAVTTYNSYKAAWEAMHNSFDEVISTREVYRLAQSRYREGQALQLELIDARTQMTNAEIRYSLAQLAVLNRASELERVMATYNIEDHKSK
ncbi:MAG: TolC family protein [Bacteroidetes bacterium]|nr:MAG: TolC family protein [Bacteroidota bacterium]